MRVLLPVAFLSSTTYAINACTSTGTIFSGKTGVRYRVCPGTDITGASQKVTPNVASVTACAQLCDQTMDCFKAVYDTQTQGCHFKAYTGLDWVVNARYTTVQAEQVNIARCPYAETTYTNNDVSCPVRKF